MRSTRWMSVVTASAFLFVAGASREAHARFGKRNDTSGSDSSHSSRSSSSSSSSSEPVHGSAPANAPSSPKPAPQSSDGRRGDGSRHHHHHSHSYAPHHAPSWYEPTYAFGYYPAWCCGWTFGYYPFFTGAPPPPAAEIVAETPPPAAEPWPTLSLGLGIQGNREGAILDFSGALEGRRWGVNGEFASVAVAAEDGSGLVDAIQLLDLHLTYAIFSSPYGRLRVEGGIGSAIAEDLSVLGPEGGVSGVLGLFGPVGIEASGYVTPWPFRKIEATGGFYLTLAPVGLRLGWKHLYLNDGGLIPGQPAESDTFTGPYFGVAFAF